MRFAIPRDPASEERTISQRIYRSDGAIEERSAGEWELHDAHGHFHYTGFGVSRLWATDAAGARVGPEPVRTADKVSFCIIDTDLDAFGEKGNGPRTYPRHRLPGADRVGRRERLPRAGHHARLGRPLRLVPARPVHRGERRAGRHLRTGDDRRSGQHDPRSNESNNCGSRLREALERRLVADSRAARPRAAMQTAEGAAA